jgi:hypothetical protein
MGRDPTGQLRVPVLNRVVGDAPPGVHHERFHDGAGGTGRDAAVAAAAEGGGGLIRRQLEGDEQVAQQQPGAPLPVDQIPVLPDPAQPGLLRPGPVHERSAVHTGAPVGAGSLLLQPAPQPSQALLHHPVIISPPPVASHLQAAGGWTSVHMVGQGHSYHAAHAGQQGLDGLAPWIRHPAQIGLMASCQPALQGGRAQGEPAAAGNGGDPHRVKAKGASLKLDGVSQLLRRHHQGTGSALVGKVPKVRLAFVAIASSDRFSPILRWIGITLVVLTLLQMLAVLALWDWQAEPFRQLVVERLIKESPMALVGLLFMYIAGRLDDQEGWRRSPLLWTVCILSGLMAVFLTASLPIVFGGDRLMQEQTDQQLAAKRGQLEMAREQSKNPEVLKQLLRQAEAAGQVPPGATEAQKIQSARAFVDQQLQQMENQFKQAKQTSELAINQRRYGSSLGAIALIVAFTLLCLGSVL